MLSFCIKLGGYATTTHGELQQAFGVDAMSKSQAFRWQNRFSEGRTVVKDEQRSGRPSAKLAVDNTAG
jgi:transposase